MTVHKDLNHNGKATTQMRLPHDKRLPHKWGCLLRRGYHTNEDASGEEATTQMRLLLRRDYHKNEAVS